MLVRDRTRRDGRRNRRPRAGTSPVGHGRRPGRRVWQGGSFPLRVDAGTAAAYPWREVASRRVAPAGAGDGCRRTRGGALKMRDVGAFAPASANLVVAATRAGTGEAHAVAALSLGPTARLPRRGIRAR